MSNPTQISKQLKRGSLRQVVERSENLRSWNELLQNQLEAPLSGHCELANIRMDTAIIQCDSSVWAAKMRFQIPQIVSIINEVQSQYQVKRVQLLVRPNPIPRPQSTPSADKLSEESSQHLAAVAETITDPLLRSALTKLSKRRR